MSSGWWSPRTPGTGSGSCPNINGECWQSLQTLDDRQGCGRLKALGTWGNRITWRAVVQLERGPYLADIQCQKPQTIIFFLYEISQLLSIGNELNLFVVVVVSPSKCSSSQMKHVHRPCVCTSSALCPIAQIQHLLYGLGPAFVSRGRQHC